MDVMGNLGMVYDCSTNIQLHAHIMSVLPAACELPPRTEKYLLLIPPTMLTRPTKAWSALQL